MTLKDTTILEGPLLGVLSYKKIDGTWKVSGETASK